MDHVDPDAADIPPSFNDPPCPTCAERRTMVVFGRWLVCANDHSTRVEDLPPNEL